MALGHLLGLISTVLLVVTAVPVVIVLLIKYKQNDIRWRFALAISLLIGVLIILDSINSSPIDKAFYPTTMLYGVFLGILIAYGVLFAMIYCMFILSTGASGDALTREVSPNSLGMLEQ